MYMRMREYNTMLLQHNYMMWREALIYYLLQLAIAITNHLVI